MNGFIKGVLFTAGIIGITCIFTLLIVGIAIGGHALLGPVGVPIGLVILVLMIGGFVGWIDQKGRL